MTEPEEQRKLHGLQRLPLIGRHYRIIRGCISIVLVALLWEIGGRYLSPSQLFFVPLSAVFLAAVKLWQQGLLQVDLWTSFVEFVCGFILGSFVGITIAMLLAASDLLRDYFDPWISALFATPIIALGPLFILWFGIGIAAKIAVIFLAVLFPVLINTYAGLTNAPPHLIECARSFGADTRQIFSKVRLPSALSYIVAGARTGVARGLVGVVVAELFGSQAGIGFRILHASQTFDTAALFASVLILAIAGVVAVELLKLLEDQLAPWRRRGLQ